MNNIDTIIHKMFSNHWSGDLAFAPIAEMRKQLHKNLTDQVNGYWSGHTAYHIMTRGGFLIDSKRVLLVDSNKCKGKGLTELGKLFMELMSSDGFEDPLEVVLKPCPNCDATPHNREYASGYIVWCVCGWGNTVSCSTKERAKLFWNESLDNI